MKLTLNDLSHSLVDFIRTRNIGMIKFLVKDDAIFESDDSSRKGIDSILLNFQNMFDRFNVIEYDVHRIVSNEDERFSVVEFLFKYGIENEDGFSDVNIHKGTFHIQWSEPDEHENNKIENLKIFLW